MPLWAGTWGAHVLFVDPAACGAWGVGWCPWPSRRGPEWGWAKRLTQMGWGGVVALVPLPRGRPHWGQGVHGFKNLPE